DMLSDAARRRPGAERRALSVYEDELVRFRARVQAAKVRKDRARAGRRWWAWLRLSMTAWRVKRGIPRPPVPAAGHASYGRSDLEEKIMAGIAGENLVAAELGRLLDDSWTLFRGYRNRRGEIDHLLLGPRGLFAIEVKNLNATVHIDGDRWRADKYDRYGNLVEQRVIADRRGRSPSVQLNEPADELARFLARRGQHAVVQRAVILAHTRSRLGTVRDPTVLAGTSVGYALDLVEASASRLDRDQRTAIADLIQRDHSFHDRRHAPSRRAPSR
ncbi:MAG TPA: nuclease-related domain-containing protein, partial [Streptosporangiaceae bacterium]|nr:nuclease-related domain-containing protein [Streptosporangiaceae bacterium]